LVTPEGRTKNQVKKVLNAFDQVYFEMPVPGGFGKSGLDFSGCAGGYAFYVETKRDGGELTGRQRDTCLRMLAAGAKVFVVSNQDGLASLYRWLRRVVPLRLPQQVKQHATRRRQQRVRAGAAPAGREEPVPGSPAG
jgi:hypothetical protein